MQTTAPNVSVLLVDNEPLVRLGISIMLKEVGLICSSASGREQAMRLVHDGLTPDLLIIDYNMPDCSGLALGEELAALYPAMKVLMVSGDDGVADQVPDHWSMLSKPFTSSELRTVINDIFPDHSSGTNTVMRVP
jgi:DNA-binding NtrC family response regulator